MTPDEIEAAFTRSDGDYVFARWGRPVAPVVFGVGDETLPVVKGAVEAISALVGRPVAETDPELGTNLMFFFIRDWDEVAGTPGMDRLLPDLAGLLDRLRAAEANQYRIFRFDPANAIRACFSFVRMDAHMAALPAEAIALAQVAQSMLLWSDRAFSETGPIAQAGARDAIVLRPEIAAILRAAYDPAMPDAARDRSHALRLFARIAPLQ